MKAPKWVLCTLLMSLLTLTGCWDYGGIEHMIYLNALGVDYVKGKYVLYAQVIDFTVLGKSEGSSGRQPERIAIGKGVGNTFDEAAFDLYRTSQERTSWSHLSALVFTQRAIEAGLPETSIDLIRRYHEIRHTMYTFGTHESIQEIFSTKPILGISTLYSRMTDPMSIYRQSSTVQPIFLNRMIASSREPACTTILPYLSIARKTWSDEKKKYQPVLETEGVGMILNSHYEGFLEMKQLNGLRWFQPAHRRMAVFSYYKGKPLAAVIFLKPKTKIITNVVGNTPTFDVQIKAKGAMLEASQALPEALIREQVIKEIQKEVRDTYEAGLKINADVLNIGLAVYRQHPADWHRVQKKAKLPLTPQSLKNVQVEVQVDLSGRLKELKRE